MKKYAPTTPSRRGMTTVKRTILSKEKPLKKLLIAIPSRGGRNNAGRITTRHQGGGHKRRYRLVDFSQKHTDTPARIEALEYDPYRTAFIARIVYTNGVRSYIIAPSGVSAGDIIVTADKAEIRTGNRMRVKNIPVGYQVHNIELTPGKGGQLARSAGSCAEILAHEDGYTNIKLSSGEVRKIQWSGFASLGQVSNPKHNLTVIGKAGRSRWLGIRPTVRGSAMNPVDHPYGGGEGKTQRGTRRPKTKWGKITGGRKTRKKNKQSNSLIIKRRKQKKR